MATFSVNLPVVALRTVVPDTLDVYVGEGGMTVVGPRSALEEWVRVNWAGESDVPEIYDFDQE